MDILKTATDWAKAEMISNSVFILLGALFIAASIAFWQIGRTDMARAYVVPTLVAGMLLLILGGGLLYGTWSSLAGFGPAVAQDGPGFVASEVMRVDKTVAQYGTAVFKVMPLLIVAAAALIIVMNSPVWRAGLITTIAFLCAVMFVDSNASARLESYRAQLLAAVSR
ncbi:hypothetical protein [Actibacterium lipolyticum]|uniref:Uncharacterized protein n=1 Tax=Actibacterium lipolyticum TaxID=1524263 RepID=A0A238JL47_9RHOB|nr:hypothetical protein [Actibacterium lipolyticum]SMX31389.1 hypothetical protein COL8621_00422 [Actibacterium lipolyticum]